MPEPELELSSCMALVSHDSWSSSRCRRPSRGVRAGLPLCGTHLRVWDRWEDDPATDAVGMAQFQWRLRQKQG